jgi:uncharacterized protein (TIGR00304 family)
LVDVTLANAGLVLIVLGFVLAFVAVIFLAFRGRGASGQTRGAGLLLIGPIPIVFGTDRESVKTLMILAIALIVIVFVVMLLIPTLLFNR